MATGLLGTPTDLTAATNASVYTVPADTFAVLTVNFANRSTQSRNIRLAIATSGTPGNGEWIEYDTELLGNGVLERSGIVVDAGKIIVAYASSSDVSCVVYGIETPTN